MPEPTKIRRRNRSIRISASAEDFIQAAADEQGIQWSEMNRRMLAYAAQHMPVGWHPGKKK